MLVAEKRLDLRLLHPLLQEAAHDLAIEELLAVFSECGGVPDRIIGAQTDKPAGQQVVVQLL